MASEKKLVSHSTEIIAMLILFKWEERISHCEAFVIPIVDVLL